MTRRLTILLVLASLACTEKQAGPQRPAATPTTEPAPAKTPEPDPAGPRVKTPEPAPTKTTAPARKKTPAPAAGGEAVAGLQLALACDGEALKRGEQRTLTLTVRNTTAGDLQLPLPMGRCGLYADLRFRPALTTKGAAHTVKPGVYTGKVVTVPAQGTVTLTFALARGPDGALAVPNREGARGCGALFVGGKGRVEVRYRVYVAPGRNPWFNLTYTHPRWTGGALVSNAVALDLP